MEIGTRVRAGLLVLGSFFTLPLLAQTRPAVTCEEMAKGANAYCKEALFSGPQPNASGSSISTGAAGLSVASSEDSARLRDAVKYCEAQRAYCQEGCANAPNQQLMSPDVKKQCEEAIAGGRLPKQSTCSPLIVQLGPEPLRMTHPRDGVVFDIKGRNAAPTAHTQIAISWVDERSRADNYFLTLPNARGEILGIDQLFGNHTFGPDPKAPFAANGFEALRKYDDGDGVIDRADAVFARLRLWHDLNGDGRAQANELVTLADAGVASIDLAAAYDPDYFEEDVFGNSIRGKSLVTMRDQTLRLLFDVWFVEK